MVLSCIGTGVLAGDDVSEFGAPVDPVAGLAAVVEDDVADGVLCGSKTFWAIASAEIAEKLNKDKTTRADVRLPINLSPK
jgi:hypothetical protein